MHYLEFDYSEDAEGQGCYEAMATVAPAQLPALQDEIAMLLDWAASHFPQQRAPLDQGGEWDFHLQAQQEWTAQQDYDYDLEQRRFQSYLHAAGEPRHQITLTLSGTAAFCDALRQTFELD